MEEALTIEVVGRELLQSVENWGGLINLRLRLEEEWKVLILVDAEVEAESELEIEGKVDEEEIIEKEVSAILLLCGQRGNLRRLDNQKNGIFQ